MEQAAVFGRATCLDDLLHLLRSGGRSDEGETGDGEAGDGETPAMTALDHHLQCAAVLEERYPDDLELQIAGLLHDVGHKLAPGQPERHGVAAADYLRELCGERIADLIELHVDAKRYLVAVEPAYRDSLSAGSARTLIAQGEALTEDEATAFAAHPRATDAVKLRRADEDAKIPGRDVPSLDAWVPVLESVVARRP